MVLKSHDSDGAAALLARLRDGDRLAAEQLVRTHAPWMLGLARRYLKDEGLAEDCVQESLCNALRSIGGFEGRSQLRSWLHRIVINMALMKLRALDRLGEEQLDLDLLPQFDCNGMRIEPLWTEIATPEELLDRKQTRDLVRSKLEELPESYRVILMLRDLEEMSTEEVAAALGITEGAAKVRLHRARAAFKRLIEPMLRRED